MKKLFLLTFLVVSSRIIASGQSVDEIINNYYNAIGGKEARVQIHTIRTKGKATMEELPFSIVSVKKRPNKFFSEVKIDGKTIITAFDGKTGWTLNHHISNHPNHVSKKQLNQFKREVFEDDLLNYRYKGFDAILEGKEMVEGEECYKVKLTDKHSVQYHFFSVNHHLKVMLRVFVKNEKSSLQSEDVLYGDYQKVGDLMFPFKVRTKVKGLVVFEESIESIEINPIVQDMIFSLPN